MSLHYRLDIPMKRTCTTCDGICCKVYEVIEVDEQDCRRMAKHLRIPLITFMVRYIDPIPTDYEDGYPYMIRKKPHPQFGSGVCPFLVGGGCSIYSARSKTCSDYPSDCDLWADDSHAWSEQQVDHCSKLSNQIDEDGHLP